MVNERKSIMVSIALKSVLVFLIIGINFLLLPKYIDVKNIATVVSISGGEDGLAAIYISSKFNLINILRYSLFLLLLSNTVILLVYDVIGLKDFIKHKIKYSIKNKIKIILAIDIFTILSIIIQIFVILLGSGISVFFNIFQISLLITIIYFMKKDRNK